MIIESDQGRVLEHYAKSLRVKEIKKEGQAGSPPIISHLCHYNHLPMVFYISCRGHCPKHNGFSPGGSSLCQHSTGFPK